MTHPLSDLLQQLQGNQSDYEIALAYALAKDGEPPKRKDKYYEAIRKMKAQPEKAQFGNLELLFRVLGVEIAPAIAIAASQAKPKQ